MPTSSLPRRVGARTGAAALAALTVAGAALLGAPAAVAAPGDNGDVKIHEAGTPVDDQNNEPKVCKFYLDAFNFDGLESIRWSIEPQPPVAGSEPLNGTIILPPSGHGWTGELSLPNGQYKLTWTFEGENGAGKQKVFKVDCPTGTPSPTPSPSPTRTGPGTPSPTPSPTRTGPGGPHGGPPAGGGGVAPRDFSPVAGAAAVGLVVTGGVVYLRLRRRPDGAA
ncbi:hypothetical protein GCM10011579_085990 [Streptomyces albiflavescens]|uniref:Gram-positive cocci surface proteins LPxTG domain-containing protein n=1 Tax=Streptomyces albiflavescens TaxID=1623582 RepID=A0A917YFZ4_9ACTN|nr:hypothetical protein [Streptomyces albiflavescens]GGN90228.1 hypothetical protein GCM10011579_085990 [Streptomyces albiflavescens]